MSIDEKEFKKNHRAMRRAARRANTHGWVDGEGKEHEPLNAPNRIVVEAIGYLNARIIRHCGRHQPVLQNAAHDYIKRRMNGETP